jgi:acetate kinase
MKPEHHRARAERIERSLELLTDNDWEIRIEGAMLAGTHWANYALHVQEVSTDTEDIVHTSMCVVNTLRKYSLVERELLQQLDEIEELRPLHVRGDAQGSREAAARALSLLAAIGQRARQAQGTTRLEG